MPQIRRCVLAVPQSKPQEPRKALRVFSPMRFVVEAVYVPLQKEKEKRGFVMALFMIVCPATGQSVSTGIRINGRAWNRDPKFHAYTHCPACGLDHEWAAGDVTLSDELAARLSSTKEPEARALGSNQLPLTGLQGRFSN